MKKVSTDTRAFFMASNVNLFISAKPYVVKFSTRNKQNIFADMTSEVIQAFGKMRAFAININEEK